MWNIGLVVLIACGLSSVNGFGDGPPWKMCSLMIPKHRGIQQQETPAPYVIITSKGTYAPNEVIKITLTSNDRSTPFRGFMLGARPLNGDVENVVGRFVNIPSNAKGASWYAVDENVPNCVSHSNSEDKTTLTLDWQAPSTSVGDIIFSSAFVQNFEVFWANVSSQPVRATPDVAIPPFPSAISKKFSSMDLTDNCGKDKGCLLYPRYCAPKNCEWVVAYKRFNETHVDFEMIAVSSGYITLGLSHDKLMGKDSTITCTMTEDKRFMSVQNGYNPAYNNERHRILGFTNIELTRFDDKIYCRFRRPIDVDLTTVAVNGSNFGTYSQVSFSLKDSWYVFLAIGSLYRETDVLGKHKQEPLITSTKVSLLGTEINYPSVFPMMVHIHGTFMLMAWMFCAGIGVILAGFFKDIFTKMTCGSRLWIRLHMGIMMSVAIFTVIGLIVILVFQGGWKERGTAHGAVGLCAVVLMVLQIVMGLIRPSPESKRRPIFYWAHLISGYTILRTSATAFFLAFTISHIPPTLRLYNTIIFGCWIGFQVIWEIMFRFLSRRSKTDTNTTVVSIDSKDLQIEDEAKAQVINKNESVLLTALALYVITLLIFFAVSIAFFYIF